MENQQNAASEVWPPPPTNSVQAKEETSPLAALAHFRVQSIWLILLLTVITAGIYAVFWLRRQSLLINSLRPDLKLSIVYANIVLAFAFVSAGLDIISVVITSPTFDTWASISDRIYGLLLLVLSFQVRGGLNGLLQVSKSDPYSFGGVYTWLFSVMYLQYKLNQNIRRWRGVSGQV